jgi:hypothetical protein
MKRTISVVLWLCLLVVSVSARQPKSPSSVTDKQWQDLLAAVSNEEWNTAVKLSSDYLKRMKEGDVEKRLSRLRYIYLYAAAGKVSAGGMSFEELDASVKDFAGKEIALPFRRIAQECRGAFNFICPSKGAKDSLMVAASNKAGTTIHAFEYVQLKESFDFAAHEGEEASIIGIIQSIKLNPNKSRFLVMRLYIADAVVVLQQQTPQKANAD